MTPRAPASRVQSLSRSAYRLRYSGQPSSPSTPVADGLPAGAVAVEVAVLELDPRPLRRLGDEPHLDLAGLLEVGLDLPLRADVPAEHDPVRWLVGEHARPPAFAAVDAAVVDVPADARLEDGLGDLDAEHVVLGRLEAAELLGEDRERALDRRLDDDLTCGRTSPAAWVLMRPPLFVARRPPCRPPALGSRTARGRREARPARRGRAGRCAGCPPRRSTTSPASLSTFRCCETAGRLTGSSRASSPTALGRLGDQLEDRAPGRSPSAVQPSTR